ncbi:MAG: beta-galactosidase trimerization domain-containing protein, partial [Candidatus Latescibacteria bacterium]|nr:beta-galactosidase trimerization domain-containing protein [Candidatus Latescibacterota bacterium]
VYGEVREILSRYPVDGIYFDQLPGSCYCSFCRNDFEREFGTPMPIVPDEFFVYNSPAGLPAQLREFRDGRVRSFCSGIRAIVNEVRPEACYAQNWVRGVQAHLAADYADVLLPEFYQKTDLVPLGMKMRLTKAYFKDRPIWGNVRHGVRHDARHFPVSPTRMLLMDCIANHAAPLMLDLCAMDYDATGVDQLAATFEDMRIVQDALANAEPVRYAALLHSRASHLSDSDRFESAFEGVYRLLFEHHVPFEIVTEQAAAKGALQHYKVAILPDAYALENATLDAIHVAATQGVGILATYTSGFANAQGDLCDSPALADLLGIQIEGVRALDDQPFSKPEPLRDVPGLDGSPFHYGSARGDHPITKAITNERLFPFLGGYVQCRPIDGAEDIAHIHLPDTERLAAPAVNRRGPSCSRYFSQASRTMYS